MNLVEKRGEMGGTQAKVTLPNLAGWWAGACAGQGKLGKAEGGAGHMQRGWPRDLV